MILKIALIFVLILWLAKVARDILFWTYLWQLKEYRLDRMKAHFELPSAKGIFLNKFYATKVALVFSSIFLFIDQWQIVFAGLVSMMYAALGGKSLYSVYAKKLRMPAFTKKALVIFTGVSAVYLVAAILSYVFLSQNFFLVTLLVFDILIPIIVALAVSLMKYPSDIAKKNLLEKAARKREEFKDVLVIGITGSYGKTTMKEFLAHILSRKLKVLKTEKNQNTEVGVANTVLKKLNSEYDVFVVEMGAYRVGEIKKICDIVKPRIGILTGINEQHVSMFGSIENTVTAKYELIESLPKQGLAVFNGENQYSSALYQKTITPKRMYSLRSFSVNEQPDISCEKVDLTPEGTRFYVKIGDKKELFETPILGRHNVLNILGATLVAHDLGMSMEEIKGAVKTLKAPPHTLEMKKGINGSILIDDSYAANPTGVYAALDVLEQMKGNKKILVFFPLIELGETASMAHRRIAAKINKACELCIVTSPDFAREISKNAPNADVLIMPDPKKAIAKLQKTVKEGDVVLIENRVPEEIVEFLSVN